MWFEWPPQILVLPSDRFPGGMAYTQGCLSPVGDSEENVDYQRLEGSSILAPATRRAYRSALLLRPRTIDRAQTVCARPTPGSAARRRHEEAA